MSNIQEEEEALKRRKTCRFIEEAGRVLRLPRVAIATAMVFFHRFYAKHSQQEHDRFEAAVAAIVLAAKTEESPKKVNVVIEEALKLKMRGIQAGRISSGGGSSCTKLVPNSLDPKSEEFAKVKERILLLERVILHTIGFELAIDHPYKFLVDIVKKMVQKKQIEFINPEKNVSTNATMTAMMNKMVQYSINFANDSMQTSLCLQYCPEKIATACVYLAGNFAQLQPTNSKKSWLEALGYPQDVGALASISLQIVELMLQDDRKGGSSTTDSETLAKLRRDIEHLKEEEDVKIMRDGEPDQKRQRVS